MNAPNDNALPINLPSQYVDLRELGKGGMGVVYLARNSLMGRDEVLKVINKTLLDRPGVLDRFLQEIQSAARLNHPNVVTAYSALRVGDSLVFSMEYVPGDDLEKYIRAKGPLSVPHACYYIQQAANGLQHAHDKGMVHRDIKPSNLVLTRDGKKPVIKILDFGLAKVADGFDANLTGEGRMMGTPDYMAPEQALDAAKADIRSDIYSLGCTLYCLLSGKPPFRGASLYELLRHHEITEAIALNLMRPEVPVELAAIVSRMIAKKPDRRLQTSGEVARALAPFIRPGTIPAASKASITLAQSQPSFNETMGPKASTEEQTLLPSVSPRQMSTRLPSTKMPANTAWESLTDNVPSASTRRTKKAKRVRGGAWIGGLVLLPLLAIVVIVAWTGGAFRIREKSEGEQSESSEKLTIATPKSSDTTERRTIPPSSTTRTVGAITAAPSPATTSTAPIAVTSSAPATAPPTSILKELKPTRLVELFGATPVSLAVGRDGRHLFVGASDGKVYMLDFRTGLESAKFEAKTSQSFSGIDVSPAAGRIAAAGMDGKIRVWNLDDRQLLGEFGQGDAGGFSVGVCLSPDGQRTFGAGDSRLWDIRLGSEVWQLPKTKVSAARYVSHDRILLGSLSDRSVRLVHSADGKPVENFSVDPASVRNLAVSFDRKQFAIAIGDHTKGGFPEPGKDYSVRLCDLESGKMIRSFDGHEQIVFGVAFLPGDRLVSCSKDQTLRVWDIASGRTLAVLRGHTQAIWDLAAMPDGKTVVSLGLDGLRYWDVSEFVPNVALGSPQTPAERIPMLKPPATLPVPFFEARVGEGRLKRILEGGGNAASERAIYQGLAWLAKQQKADGRWEFRPSTTKAAGSEDTVAATALVLLAFLGHGDSPNSGTSNSKIVEAGTKYLVGKLNGDGAFGEKPSMYTQAIATLALIEASHMYAKAAYRGEAARAVAYIVKSQAPNGSWGYEPNKNGDTSVTGWHLQALGTYKRLNGTPFTEPFRKATLFLNEVSTDNGAMYGYKARGNGVSTTAIGLHSRHLLGWQDPQAIDRGAKFLASALPKQGDVNLYALLYIANVLHEHGGEIWHKTWNPAARDFLIDLQTPAANALLGGSWPPDNGAIGTSCGRIGTTAMAINILQVYYRYPKFAEAKGK